MEWNQVIIKDLKKILNNNSGVALMMIMTSIIILMAIYGQFTFDSKISRIKAINIIDKSQAKLLAESGLQLAMARLKLYQAAYNKIQANKAAKDMVSGRLLNQLWEVPFIYPVPLTKDATIGLKNTIEKFHKESLLEGEMKVSIQNISNRLNLNLLRMDMAKFDPEANDPDATSQIDLGLMSERASDLSIAQTIYNILRTNIDLKKEKDELFQDRVDNLNYQNLISNLKFFISDYQSLNQDPFSSEAEDAFNRIPMRPKYGPMSSDSELYSIPGWNDELVELVKNEFSAHPFSQIDLNKITPTILKILFPEMSMNEDSIPDFYAYKDDPENPKFFNSLNDFKEYFVNIANLLDEEKFNERIKYLELKGIKFGPNPNFFKVVSEGSYNRSTYTLIAFVSLPVQNQNTPSTSSNNPLNNNQTNSNENDENNVSSTATTSSGNTNTQQSTQLLEPRVVEIQII